jgi:FixJ family two-component response regulator
MMSGAFTSPTPDRLPKPFTDRELIAAVERALARGRG